MLSLLLSYSRVIGRMKERGRLVQDRVFRLPALFLAGMGVSPYSISIISLFCVFVSALLLFGGSGLYLAFLLAAIAFDMLDGTLARLYGKTKLGADFDFFLDRFSDGMLVLAFYASGMVGFYLSLALLFFYVLSTLLAGLSKSGGGKVYLISYRIVTVGALLLQFVLPWALSAAYALLLVNYSFIAAVLLPKSVFHEKRTTKP